MILSNHISNNAHHVRVHLWRIKYLLYLNMIIIFQFVIIWIILYLERNDISIIIQVVRLCLHVFCHFSENSNHIIVTNFSSFPFITRGFPESYKGFLNLYTLGRLTSKWQTWGLLVQFIDNFILIIPIFTPDIYYFKNNLHVFFAYWDNTSPLEFRFYTTPNFKCSKFVFQFKILILLNIDLAYIIKFVRNPRTVRNGCGRWRLSNAIQLSFYVQLY